MLRPCEVIGSYIVEEFEICFSVYRNMRHCADRSPILRRRIRIEDLRHRPRRDVCQQAVLCARRRVGLRLVGEWENAIRILVRPAGCPRRLREALIEAASCGTANVCQYAVKDFSLLRISIETVVQEATQ